MKSNDTHQNPKKEVVFPAGPLAQQMEDLLADQKNEAKCPLWVFNASPTLNEAVDLAFSWIFFFFWSLLFVIIEKKDKTKK